MAKRKPKPGHGGPREGAGPKPRGDEKRTASLIVRVTADELEQLKAAADPLPMSTHVRRRLGLPD